MKEGGPSFCLRNPPHLMGKGDVVCRQCGALAQDILIGPYQIKRFLRSERGNQAYLALPKGQTQPVLVKLFPPDPASQHLWERAWHEMHLLAELQHKAILPVLNCLVWKPELPAPASLVDNPLISSDNSRAFLAVMYQYAPVTLQNLMLNKAPISPQNTQVTIRRLFHIVEQVTGALIFAHSLGAIHGALEPENILLNAQLDRVWIADFGLARLQLPRAPFLAPELVPASRVCEQRRDVTPYWDAITEASDQYALAVLCYQLFLYAIPPVTFQRILPVLQHASQAEPALRFQHLSDFSSALAVELGISQFSLPESDASGQQDLAQEGGNVLPLSPSQQADQAEQLAGKNFTARNYEAAVQAYLQALRLDPVRTSVLAGLADAYFALELYTEALLTYGKVLDLDPNNAEAWFNQATVLDLLGRSDQAVRGYERAEQLRAEAARRPKYLLDDQ